MPQSIKKVSLEKVDVTEVKTALDFFLSEIDEMIEKKQLEILPVERSTIIGSRTSIFDYNLYAADALHATSVVISGVIYFITFDGDFKVELGEIEVLNPADPGFKGKITGLKMNLGNEESKDVKGR